MGASAHSHPAARAPTYLQRSAILLLRQVHRRHVGQHRRLVPVHLGLVMGSGASHIVRDGQSPLVVVQRSDQVAGLVRLVAGPPLCELKQCVLAGAAVRPGRLDAFGM